jgi:uncharacterized protein YfdQ (DUF2303 family)
MADPKQNNGQAPAPAIYTPILPGEVVALAQEIQKRTGAPFSSHPDAAPLMLIPDGFRLHEMEEHLPAPMRVDVQHDFLDLQGFVDYVNRFKTPNTVIFIDVTTPRVMAVIDYHAAQNGPSWCKHKAVYAFPNTKEWLDWFGQNKQVKDQAAMGLFIEEHLAQIIEPDSGKLLETVIRMKEIRKVTYGKAVDLQSGMTEFNYIEEGEAGGTGKFQLPQIIKLGMAPFRDGAAYPIDARMRYRCEKEAGLKLWYELVRPDLVIDAAVKDVRAKVIDQTSVPLFAAKLPA